MISAGNFHGQPLALALDMMAIAVTELGSISERRTDRLLDPNHSSGLPAFLSPNPGINSGYMLAQYTAAALVAENRVLSHPASVETIPTSGSQEDHVSMGWGAARKLWDVLMNTRRVLAIEILCAAQGLEYRKPLLPSPGCRRWSTGSDKTFRHWRTTARSQAKSNRSPSWWPPASCWRPPGSDEAVPVAWPGTQRRDAVEPIHAPRGTELTTKGWLQEAALRCLMNNLDPEVAENPDELVVYGGRGKAARNWDAYHAIVRSLRELENDETLLVQSGKPVGVFRTHEMAPRVLIANSLLVPDWADWETFWELEAEGLMMYGQMTAGSWIYIGTQGILQGTYQTFLAIAERSYGGTLRNTLTLTAGLGGMGGAQPLAVSMNDGVSLNVEVDPTRIERRLETRYLDEWADDLDSAVARALAAKEAGEAVSIGVLGNAAEVFPELLRRGVAHRHRDRSDLGPRSAERLHPHRLRRRCRRRPPGGRSSGVHQGGSGVDGPALRGHGRIPGRRRRGVRLRQQPARRGGLRRIHPGV